MKYKTTKKAVLNGYTYTIAAPYCTLQNMLAKESPIAYTTRREGWGADIYDFGNTAIITGYSPFGAIHPAHLQLQDWDEKARELLQKSTDQETTQKALNALIADFLDWAKEAAR